MCTVFVCAGYKYHCGKYTARVPWPCPRIIHEASDGTAAKKTAAKPFSGCAMTLEQVEVKQLDVEGPSKKTSAVQGK